MQHRYPNRPQPQQWGPPHPNQGPPQQQPHYGGQMYEQPNFVTHPHAQQYHRQITIEDAIGIAREQVSGQVVQAELERKGGRLIYEVDIISDQGPKYEVKVDASTGEVIEVELD